MVEAEKRHWLLCGRGGKSGLNTGQTLKGREPRGSGGLNKVLGFWSLSKREFLVMLFCYVRPTC